MVFQGNIWYKASRYKRSWKKKTKCKDRKVKGKKLRTCEISIHLILIYVIMRQIKMNKTDKTHIYASQIIFLLKKEKRRKKTKSSHTGTPLAMRMLGFMIVVSWCSKSGACSKSSGAVSFMASSNLQAAGPGTPYQDLGSPLYTTGQSDRTQM